VTTELHTKEVWLAKTFGGLSLDPSQELPSSWTRGTTKQFWFLCKCGRRRLVSMNTVSKGLSTCGKCSEVERATWMKRTFGSLRLDPEQCLPEAWKPNTTARFVFLCACGKKTRQKMNTVTSGLVKTCGKCNVLSASEWSGKTLGRITGVLQERAPVAWGPGSEKKIPVRCSCGREFTVLAYNLTNTRSCGCCGCGISQESKEFGACLKEIFPDLLSEQKLDGLQNRRVDFYAPEHKIAFEYNGLIWHSSKTVCDPNHRRDYHKYRDCSIQGIRLIQVYSDDWRDRRSIFLDLIRRMGPGRAGKRLYRTKPRSVSRAEAETFLNANHYLSGRKVFGSLYVGLFAKDKLCAVSVFKKTGKRKPGEIDWIRHAVLLGQFGWNLGQKCLDYAVEKLNPSRVISFSDNRIHTGNMYSQMGFSKTHTSFSYEYTDGLVRKHKFSPPLRVKRGTNEEAHAADLGWFRVYDSGKTKWVLDIPPKSTP
jgi:predicted SprT family Zn-dependent metalloprotease